MNEEELYEFAKMFDAAIASDNPAVKKALRNFMLIAAISETENETTIGSFQGVFDRLTRVEEEVSRLKNNQSPGYYGSSPTWITGTGYPSSYSVTSAAGTHTSTTNAISSINSSTVTEQQIIDLLSDLKSESYWTDDEVSSLEQAYKDSNAT